MMFFFLILCWLMFSKETFAFGPVVHIEISRQVLAGVLPVAPAILSMIRKNRNDFIFGSLAADLIIGKNRVDDSKHSHNINVVKSLLKKAQEQGDDLHSFMLGYMCHLGADIVAHNLCVPKMLIVHYGKRGAGHLYWETRIDQRVFSYESGVFIKWKELSVFDSKRHMKFLKQNLTSSIFPNTISAGIYKGNLQIQQSRYWRKIILSMDKKSKLLLSSDELKTWREKALHCACKLIENNGNDDVLKMDPTGRGALNIANRYRKKLRASVRRKRSDDKILRIYERALKTIEQNSKEIAKL